MNVGILSPSYPMGELSRLDRRDVQGLLLGSRAAGVEVAVGSVYRLPQLLTWRELGQSHAEPDARCAFVQAHLHLRESPLGISHAAVGQSADELVPSPSDDDVITPKAAEESRSNVVEHPITGIMALLVVRALQSDDVQEGDDELRARPGRPLNFPVQLIPTGIALQGACEQVDVGAPQVLRGSVTVQRRLPSIESRRGAIPRSMKPVELDLLQVGEIDDAGGADARGEIPGSGNGVTLIRALIHHVSRRGIHVRNVCCGRRFLNGVKDPGTTSSAGRSVAVTLVHDAPPARQRRRMRDLDRPG
jgi:hypothetical protein